MRKSQLTATEIQAAEEAQDNRRSSRRNGFSMMPERDRGWRRLKNGTVILWHVPEEKREEWVVYQHVPEGHFALDINGKIYGFELDDFQKGLRWA